MTAVNKQTKGVEYVWEHNHDRQGQIYARKEVIVSCGTINSPQILKLSGVDPRNNWHPDCTGFESMLQIPDQHQIQWHCLILLDSQKTTPSDEGILEYYESHQGTLSTEGSYQVTAPIPSWYTSPFIGLHKIQFRFLPKM
jgi:hypothetical protein